MSKFYLSSSEQILELHNFNPNGEAWPDFSFSHQKEPENFEDWLKWSAGCWVEKLMEMEEK